MKPDVLKIAVLPGDGIGIDVTLATLPVFQAFDIPVALTLGDIGWSCWKNEGTPIPRRTWELIEQSDTVLLGATTSKPPLEAQKEWALTNETQSPYVSPIIQLRQNLDLYANVRPCFNIKGKGADFDFCVIRENTEGLYAGFDYHPLPEALQNLLAQHSHWQSLDGDEISCALRLQSTPGLLRLFRFAFQYAINKGMKRVTFADKPNVLRQSGEFARVVFEQISREYPTIKADILNVDAVALWLIRRPEEFGVIVAENMFGDILSDVGAGVMGGLGLAPSANIGQNGCYFEPVHGSAPRIEQNLANPSAMFLTTGLLLEHFGFKEEAKKIRGSVEAVVKARRFVTYDLGGKATTQDMANAIIEKCLHRSSPINVVNPLQRLQAFSSAELSDALDAMGIEGALLGIKPLASGLKLIGPAFTIKYLPNEQKSTSFKHAANYIDHVPAGSVIIIDNNGAPDCTVWGEILTVTAIQKDIAGTVVYGAVRDVAFIRQVKFPLYCTDFYMRSGKNRIYKVDEQGVLVINGVTIRPGDIIFADDNGVLVIPLTIVDEVINKAQAIERTEKKIIEAVKSGTPLEQARRDYRYDMPWLNKGS
ncbi:MAG: isocitrate/isopropylmalate family dehydrogenase [Legionella sp.]|nr:isocitrate/isopropylmalate family dehydrogenase [Legionella sp.]